MNKLSILSGLFAILMLTSCATQEPFYNASVSNWQESVPDVSSELMYQIYLIGDSRRAFEQEALMNLMESHLGKAGENSAVVFLGDHVQPSGLPDSTHRHWDVAQKSLDAHVKLLKNFRGETFFIPGNHDWARGGREGLEYVKNQRKYIEKNLDKKKVLYH